MFLYKKNAPHEGRFFWRAALAATGVAAYVAAFLASNHYLPWVSFHNEVPIFVALLALASALCCHHRWVVLPPAIWLAPLVVICLITVQLFSGTLLYSAHALIGAMYVAGIGVAWWLGAASVRLALTPESCLAGAATTVVLAAALSGGIATLQWLRLENVLGIYAVELAPGSRPAGNLAQPNLLASLLVMGVVATGLLWHLSRLRSWQGLALLAYFSFVLVMTESRAGLLSAACVGVVMVLRSGASGWETNWRVVALWWLMLLVFRWSWGPLNEFLLLQAPREFQAGVDGIRQILWTQIASAIFMKPWVGYGWNQTQVAQKAGVTTVPGEWPTDYAHNVVLDIIAWFGIPVGMLLLGFSVWWMARTARRMKNTSELLLLCMVMPVLVHSLLEFPFAYAFFLFPVACALGALHALQAPSSWPIRPSGSAQGWRLAAAGFLAVYALVAGRVFVEYLDAEEDMRVMRFELRRVGQRPIDHSAPQLVLLNQLDDMLKLGRTPPGYGMPPDLLARMDRANAFLNWATLHLNYVVALGLNGQPEEASRQLHILRDLYGPQTYLQAKAEFLSLRDFSYPELAAVELP